MVRAMLRSAIPRVARRAPVAHCTCFHTLPSLRAQTLASPVSVSPSSTPLRQVFDSPSFVTSNPTSTVPTGLFLQPLLTTPDAFLDVAEQTILRAQVLVTRICAPSEISDSLPGVESQFLAMVKNLDRLSDLLCGVIDLAELVRNVHPDEAWNEGANEAYESLCAYMNVLNTHVGLYQALKSLHSILPPSTPTKSPELFAAYAVAVPFLRDFEKSGIHLPDSSRAQFVDLSTTILQLGRKFLQNVSEPREGVALSWGEVEEGMGEGFARRIWAGVGQTTGKGKVDPSSHDGRVMARHHPSGDVRRKMFVGANAAPESHVETLEELLRTRAKLATLVGRQSWGNVALDDKMAGTPTNVMGFLDALNQHNLPLANKDLTLLKATKKAHLKTYTTPKIEPWDRDFYSDLSSSSSNIPDISPFLSLGTCFLGLSNLFTSLYGISFQVDPIAPGETWESGVRKLRVMDEDEGRIGTIYCDLFAREGKQPGAAHYTVRCSRRIDDDDVAGDFDRDGRAEVDGVSVSRGELEQGGLSVEGVKYSGRKGVHQEPIVALVCAFAKAGGKDGMAFLQWHEVETLFHEMGHAIHSMIGRTEYHNVSGTRCATDFVELPSILMEHFLSSPDVLRSFALHHQTGRALPLDIIKSLFVGRQRFSALETSTQITMAAADQAYHSQAPLERSFDSTRVWRETMAQYHVVGAAEGTMWQTQFGHLFGYGATYYSYLFDRAIAARIFATEFSGDPMNRDAGEAFKKGVLQWGGGKDPWEMVGQVVKSDVVAKGGRDAMEEVGKWGIEDYQV